MSTLFTLALAVSLMAAPLGTPPQLDYIDAQVQVFDARLQTFQADYVAQAGEYYQALQSHATAPAALAAPDDLTDHPTDQATALAALWTDTGLPVELGWAFSVSTYNGPSGMGYVLTISTVIDGTEYRRQINHGPEDWRAADWYAVSPDW
jgi:hypothetical protein